MADYWERMPNPAGRERGPIYRRTLAGIQFILTPHWRPTRRYSLAKPKVVGRANTPLIKDGYEIEGMPKLRVRGTGQPMLRLAPTLSTAKASCERFAREVEEGKRDPKTGDPK